MIVRPDGPVHVLGRDGPPQSTTRRTLTAMGKVVALTGLLYLFICSLTFLSSSFRLLGGRAAGRFVSDSQLLQNPVVGLMIGVLVTVLVQSSSTSTSIVVTMVGSDLIRVQQAIPIVMGANVGTSVTNTIVSLMQVSERDEFRRAFAAATVHDMFNWLTVLVLMPLESTTGYLRHTTDALMSLKEWKSQGKSSGAPDLLKVVTRPFTESIVRLNKKVLEKLATSSVNETIDDQILVRCCSQAGPSETQISTYCITSCPLLNRLDIGDGATGVILLISSLAMLCFCLVMVVKLLNSMLQGKIAVLIKKYINSDYEFPLSMFIGYLAILIGCIMTILVQSSSIFTSALTPLAGIGVISLERIYPLTLGSNIGTTTTGIMAALASDPGSLRNSLQLAFCHLLFNVTGILLFYPVPFMRIPVRLARGLGNTTVKYRWFSVFYLFGMFFLLPVAVFSLSCIGPHVFVVVGTAVLLLVLLIVLVNVVQAKRPNWLPFKYRTWDWLPLWMHSLDPIDRVITRVGARCPGCACLQDESRRDASALGLRANQSQLHILEAAKPLAGCDSEAHIMCAYDQNDFTTWNVNHSQTQLSPSHTVTNGHLNVASGGMTMKHLDESTPL